MMDENKVKEDARKILDKFAKALNKVDFDKFEEGVDREAFEREEGGECVNDGFKKRILDNAPESDNDFIIAERGNWK